MRFGDFVDCLVRQSASMSMVTGKPPLLSESEGVVADRL